MEKNVVLFDYEALLMRYRRIYNPSLKIRLLFKKYLLALSTLENLSNCIDINYSYNLKTDSYIIYFIGEKILNDLYKSSTTDDKELDKRTIELLKKETKRIIDYTKGINDTSFNCCRITRQQAKDIMLQYMTEEEINKEILELYPETMKDVFMRNQVRNCLTDKFKDGSIVKRKINLITKRVERKF